MPDASLEIVSPVTTPPAEVSDEPAVAAPSPVSDESNQDQLELAPYANTCAPIRMIGRTVKSTAPPWEYMSKADCVVCEDMLHKHHYRFYDAEELEKRPVVAYTAKDLLSSIIGTSICEVKRKGVSQPPLVPLTPEGLRQAQIALVNGCKAIAYSQEVHFELNRLISQEVLEMRTMQLRIDVHAILRHMMSSELQESFAEPELA